MHTRHFLFTFVALLTGLFATLVARQRKETLQLRTDARLLRAAQADLARLRTAHEHLTSASVTRAELAALQEASSEAQRLRAEANALRAGRAVTAKPSPLVPKRRKPSSSPWTDAGRHTPAAAIESALWSSAHGEIETLATLLAFEPDTLARIEDVYATLPEEQRIGHGSPAEVFATLAASRMPVDLKQVEIVETTANGGENTTRIRLTHSDGRARESTFRLQQDAGGWRIVVPARVVNDCLRMITGKSESAATK